MTKPRIAVLHGGLSAERDVSLRSGKAAYDGLVRKGYDVRLVDADRDLAVKLLADRPDIAWIALHGKWGEDGCVQGLLEYIGIPYTGSGVQASANAMNKVTSIALLRNAGVPVAKSIVLRKGDVADVGELRFPIMIKPRSEGSSIGVSKVDSADQLPAALAEAFEHDSEALAEEFIVGAEVNVGIVEDRALGDVEVRTTRPFYDYIAKYTPGHTQYILPAPLADDIRSKAWAVAEQAHRALGCRDFSRVDLMIDRSGQPYCLEVNTLPGLTETSLLPKIAAQAGISFDDLMEAIALRAALEIQ